MICRRNGVESVVSRKVYREFLQPDRTEDAQLGLVEVVSAVVEEVFSVVVEAVMLGTV
jgi:hypothetical protein